MSNANTPQFGTSQSENQMAMFLHLSQFAGYVIPLGGLIVPIVIWLTQKESMPSLDAHGKAVANWILSELIYAVICFLLVFVFVGFILAPILALLGIVFPIIGAIKANNGELWEYPGAIRFFS